MGRFAVDTQVPVERSKLEIEANLRKYGASAFATGWDIGRAMVSFKISNLAVQFILPYPDRSDDRFLRRKVSGRFRCLASKQGDKVYEQEIRSRWRALNLVVKAKLEAVECGISTIENEFLAYVVIPGTGGATIGQWMAKNVVDQIKSGATPLALGPATGGNHGEA